jgi:hypothetical protein
MGGGFLGRTILIYLWTLRLVFFLPGHGNNCLNLRVHLASILYWNGIGVNERNLYLGLGAVWVDGWPGWEFQGLRC